MYLDTSVLAAYISELVEVELASAVAWKVREESISAADANKILNRFQSHLNNNSFQYLSVESFHFQQAWKWVASFSASLRVLDALHLALAASLGLELITADRQLAQSATYFGVDVRCLQL